MKEGWEYKKLGELFDITSSKRVFQSEWKTSGVPFYRAREIVQLSKNGYVDNELFITKELYSEYTEKYGKPQKGDIMVTGVGTLGICYLVKDNDKFYFKDGNIIWLRKKTDNLSEYIEYAFKSYFVKSQVENSSGATVGTYTIVRANKTIVPIPRSISEQQHIVEELDLLSSIIEKKKAQLNELDNLAQSLFYEMFGDPITNENGWEVDMLENVVANDCTISYGIVQPGDDVLDGIPVVRPVDLVTIVVEREGLKRVAKDISDSYKRTILKGGEILLCVRGTTGIMSFASSNLAGCNVTRGITPLAFGDKLNKYYAFCYLKSKHIQDIIADNTRGATLKQINMKDVRQLPMLIPPIDLQNQFASKIEAIEHQKELIKQSIKEVETLFNSRMDYYFN